MKKAFGLLIVAVLVGYSLYAFSTTEEWDYTQNHDCINGWQSDELVIISTGFDPNDYYTGDNTYTITEVGFYTHGWVDSSSDPCNVKGYLLPDKYTSPEGLTQTYSLDGQTVEWISGMEYFNSYTVNWGPLTEGQCIGIAFEFPNGTYQYSDFKFLVYSDNGPQDTGNWYYCLGEWHEVGEYSPRDYSIVVTVNYEGVGVQTNSVGNIKALFS